MFSWKITLGTFIMAMALAGAVPAWADVFPASSDRVLRSWQLEQLGCRDLWYARNEIYARNGYIFRTRRGQRAFGRGGFTRNPRLNRVERLNIRRIKDIEDYRCR